MSADDIDVAALMGLVAETAANAAAAVVERGLSGFTREWISEGFDAFHAITGHATQTERRHQDLLRTQREGWEKLADAHYRGLCDLGREVAEAIRNT